MAPIYSAAGSSSGGGGGSGPYVEQQNTGTPQTDTEVLLADADGNLVLTIYNGNPPGPGGAPSFMLSVPEGATGEHANINLTDENSGGTYPGSQLCVGEVGAGYDSGSGILEVIPASARIAMGAILSDVWTPYLELESDGEFLLLNTAPTEGQVITANADLQASWATPSGGDGTPQFLALATTYETDGSGAPESTGVGVSVVPTATGRVWCQGIVTWRTPNGFVNGARVLVYRTIGDIPAQGDPPGEDDTIVFETLLNLSGIVGVTTAYEPIPISFLDADLLTGTTYRYYIVENDGGSASYLYGDDAFPNGTNIMARTTT